MVPVPEFDFWRLEELNMSLSCSCDSSEEYSWSYTPANDYSILETSRRKRCSSCNNLIDLGSTVALFQIERPVRTFIEESIYDDGWIPLANKYLCEECADLYFSLQDLGFSCVAPDENMKDLIKLYQAEYVKNVQVALFS